MRKIRKQVYLDPGQDETLRSFAARWDCSEAGVIRIALERLRVADIAGPAVQGGPDDDDADLSDEESEALEAENEGWFRAHPAPLGLSEGVFQDREGR
jgi:hypothetical protein